MTLLHFRKRCQIGSIEKLRALGLELIRKILKARGIILMIHETGDKHKGSKTDYVKRQYIGNARESRA